YRALGLLSAAERAHRDSLALRLRLYGGDHQNVRLAQNNLAEVLEDRGDLQGAADLLEQVVKDPTSAANLARVRLKQGRLEEAESLLNSLGVESGSLLEAAAMHTRALAAMRRGNLQDATNYFAGSLTIRKKLLPPSHPVLAPLLLDYADLLKRMKRRK